jgi:thiol-disulfide isomerase/thioredoxin
VLVALAAGALGVIASLLTTGPGPLLRSEPGQRALNAMLSANAPKPPTGIAIAQLGQSIPRMTLSALDGSNITLPAAYRGRRLLVNVWASWCGPCVREMPDLQRYSAKNGANGTQVVGIALDDAVAVRAFLKHVAVSYPILLDTPGPADAGVRLGNASGVLPYSILVSPDGHLLKQRIGPFAEGEIAGWARD